MQRYRTSPNHWLDQFLWPLLSPTWDRLTHKSSHFWHWRSYTGLIQLPLTIAGDPKAGDRSRGFFANIYYTDFGWQGVAVLQPTVYRGRYQIGYSANVGGKRITELCAVILKGPTAVLKGPYTTQFFAIGYPSGDPIQLTVVEHTTKRKHNRDIPLI